MIILQYTLSIWKNKPRDDAKENRYVYYKLVQNNKRRGYVWHP